MSSNIVVRAFSLGYQLAEVLVRFEWMIGLLVAPLLLFPDAFRSLALLVIPLTWSLRRIARGRFIDGTPLNWSITLLVIMVLVSLYATYDIAVSLPKVTGILLGVAVFYGVVHHSIDRRSWAISLATFLLGGFGLALGGLIGTNWDVKFAFMEPVLSLFPLRVKGLPGALQGFHPNEVAGALLWFIPLAWSLGLLAILRFDEIKSILGRLRAWLILVSVMFLGMVTTLVLILTQSRGGIVALVVTSPIILKGTLSNTWRRSTVLEWLFLLASLLITSGYLLGAPTAQGAVSEWRMAENPGLSLDNLVGRVEIWSRAIYAIQDFPFTGMGLNTFRHMIHLLYPLFTISPEIDIGHAHNAFLQAALDLGILGLIAYLSINISALWMLVQVWQRRDRLPFPKPYNRALIFGLGGGLTAYLVYGLFDTLALGAKPGVFWWYLLGLIASFYRISIGFGFSMSARGSRLGGRR